MTLPALVFLLVAGFLIGIVVEQEARWGYPKVEISCATATPIRSAPPWVRVSCAVMVQQHKYPNMGVCLAAAENDKAF